MKGLYFYKLVSPYPNDVTKNCKLTINEIDSNFLTLEDADIKSAEFDKEQKALVLTRNNGEKLVADLSDAVYNLEIGQETSGQGLTITFTYETGGEEKTVTIEDVITADNLWDNIKDYVKYSVITDATLVGNGTINSPLGIRGVEKTGSLAPAIKLIDVTAGEELPCIVKKGTRYVTREFVNDYGYLYDGKGLDKIKENLSGIQGGWRVPTKEDWDKLLNSIEPCEYRNHDSAKCHVELGFAAGKFFKSDCGWLGQQPCSCGGNSSGDVASEEGACVNGTYAGQTDCTPKPDKHICDCPSGVDKYNFRILPAGTSKLDVYGTPEYDNYTEKAIFWTDTHVYDDPDQDLYVKEFDFDKCGVMQEADCPDPFYSVRLVKDYNGNNFFDNEFVDGVNYKTILFPQTGQVWLGTNYAKTVGFVPYTEETEPEYVKVNGGDVIENRIGLYINEFNGCYWEKRELTDGETVVLNQPLEGDSGVTFVYYDESGSGETTMRNIEYRVFIDENCNSVLENTDDLVFERVLEEIITIIEAETERAISAETALDEKIDSESDRAISAETALDEKIDAETDRAISAETALDEKIDAETERAISAEAALEKMIYDETDRAISAETALNEKIDAETDRAISAETALDEKIDAETERAIEREDEIEGMTIDGTIEYTMFANGGLVIKLKNGEEIQVDYDGDFGTF